MKIQTVEQDIFVKRTGQGLAQLVRVAVENGGAAAQALLRVRGGVCSLDVRIDLPAGESAHEVLIDELDEPRELEFTLVCEGVAQHVKRQKLRPPRHWIVHVVQLSHHDWGYTDIPSNVEKDHCRWLDGAVDIAMGTDGTAPDSDGLFRVVLEQCWSVDKYLKTAPEARVREFVRLMREGRFELTALFGNMTTEIMGHEQLYRALYHAFSIKRRYGIDIVSAEHNDITGISWGVSRVLTDAGVRLFCPGLPKYYDWGHEGLPSFWDQKAVFGHDGPGAFWWEAPSGKRLLFWCNNSGCGGDCHPGMPGLAPRLRELEALEEKGDAPYPYRVLRWPVGGAARDNSPFISGYLDTVRRWNGLWAYPRLSISTNARFYRDFVAELPAGLPVHRGELAGQDYPAAASSTAGATAANRGNHTALGTAEAFSVAALAVAGRPYPAEAFREARECSLYHDEHVWGYHFPCGPAMRASESQKEERALRAAAIAHGAVQKAIAAIADRVHIANGQIHLVVFNPTGYMRTGPVRAPLREIDNSGSQIVPRPPGDPDGGGCLRGVLLGDRWHVNPPEDIVQGRFRLVDGQTGREVPFQIERIASPMDTVPWAAGRLGLGSGTRRYGFFENPEGLLRDICFVASGVPPYGYRTYRLEPAEPPAPPPAEMPVQPGEQVRIENQFFLVTVDGSTGAVIGIRDIVADRELVDGQCPHGFFTPVVRDARLTREYPARGISVWKREGPVCSSIEIDASTHGHPAIRRTIRLYRDCPRVYLDARFQKDATPLLTTQIAFPFLAQNPQFRYEGCLSAMHPVRDYLPGSHSDTVAVQNWVKVQDRADGHSMLWASLDAPVAGLGGCWPGYTSPAHRCVFEPALAHPPLKDEDLSRGWIYSQAFANNYGTNFSVTQTGDVLFRYVLASAAGDVPDGQAAAFGAQAMAPFEPIYTRHERERCLPPVSGFVTVGNPDVLVLCLKQAEDGCGAILRLWNVSAQAQAAEISMPHSPVQTVQAVTATEDDGPEDPACRLIAKGDHGFTVEIKGNAVAALRVE